MHGAVRRALSAVAAIAIGLSGLALGAPAASATPTEGPTLVSPGAFDEVTGNQVLQWTAVAGATKYRVQVSASATFSPLLYGLDTYALHFAPPGDLPSGTIYWRVAAIDATGVGPFSDSQFMKKAAAGPSILAPLANPNPDGAAQLSYPADAPVLKWTPLSSVKNYEIWLDDNDTFSSPAKFTTNNTSYALVDPLHLDKAWFWQVRGVSATTGVTSDWSPMASFILNWPTTSGKPTLTLPANDPSVEVQDVKFTWTPVVGAKAYDIQVSPNGDWANNIVDKQRVKGTQYSPTQTYNNASYYWRVRAVDTGSTEHFGPWSDPSVFTRGWTDKPSLQTPIGGTTLTTPLMRFAWTGVSKAAYYQLQISTDSNFSTVLHTCTTYHTTLTPYAADCPFKPTRGARYYWHVRGVDTPGSTNPAAVINGVWSDTESFFYDPAVVDLVSPFGGNYSAPVLSWMPLEGYNQYRVVLKTGTTTTTDTTYSTTWSPTTQLAAGSYTWYVQGVGLDGVMTPVPGVLGSFTLTAPPTTGSVATPNPADPGELATDMPSLSWAPVTGANYYQVWYAPAGGDVFQQLTPSSQKPGTSAYTFTGDPVSPGDYQWYVKAFNNTTGEISGVSALGSFTVAAQQLVEQTLPVDCTLNTVCVDEVDTPELAWNAVPGTYKYKLYVAKDVNFTNVYKTYETQFTHLTPKESYPDSQAGESYYWYVQACKSANTCGPLPQIAAEADRGNVSAFRKRSPEPVLLAPANGSTVTGQVAFDWQDYFATEPDSAGAKQYKIEVATDPAFNTIVDSATVDQPFYAPWTKDYADGVYYWRVQAIDGSGLTLTRSDNNGTEPTDPWRFQKISAKPTGLSSSGVGGFPTVKWAPMADAGSYQVEVFKGGVDDNYPSVNRVLAATTRYPAYIPGAALPPLPNGEAYSWRVRKLNVDGYGGPWSGSIEAGKNFQIAEVKPELVSPAADSTDRDNDLVFTWKAVSGAASYRFESSTSSTFSGSLFEQQTTVMTTWVPTTKFYTDEVGYYWRVRVLDGAGNSLAVSVVRNFYKDAKAPTVTGLTPTSNVPLAGPVTVTFRENVKGVSPTTLKLKVAGTTTYVAGSTSTTTAKSATWQPTSPLAPGQKYVLEATSGITDVAGNPLAAYTSPVLRTALVVDSGAPVIRQLWDVDTSSYASGGSYSVSAVAGGMATFSFTGTQVSLIGVRGAGGGYADVYLDGVKKATANFYSASTVWKQTVWSISGLTNAKHTVQVKVLGTKYSSSKGTEVYIDAFDVSGARTEGTSSLVTYTFRKVSTTSALGNSYDMERYVSDAGGRPEWQMTFRGTGVDWYATKLPSAGQAYVYIDNVYKATINLYAASATYKAKVYYSPTLTDAVHTIRIVSKGTKGTSSATATDVTMDYFAVR